MIFTRGTLKVAQCTLARATAFATRTPVWRSQPSSCLRGYSLQQPSRRCLSLPFRQTDTFVPARLTLQHNSLLGETTTQRTLRVFGGILAVGLVGFAVTFPFVWTSDMRDVPKIFLTALERYLKDAWTVTQIIYIYKSRLRQEFSSEEAREAALCLCHSDSAELLRELFEDNGGIYIKLGQMLGLLDYIVPQEYVSAMQGMFDAAPVSSWEDIRAVVKEDLGADIEELFTSFDPVPVASASLAQVHRAVTKQGQEVAVKVQHRGLREESVGDVYTVAVLVAVVKQVFADFNYTWLVEVLLLEWWCGLGCLPHVVCLRYSVTKAKYSYTSWMCRKYKKTFRRSLTFYKRLPTLSGVPACMSIELTCTCQQSLQNSQHLEC
eukprot:m.151518 g.151518  ORF g.151518 m.151518 type:complete len:379 (-) comp16340_c0_seq3:2583-3719(-)